MPEARLFTPADKLKAVQRELGYRRIVYAKRVAEGRMKQAQADREIAIFEAIALDYVLIADQERAAADLFGEGGRA